MVYTTNIPLATDLISNSQAQILGNFQFLGDTTGLTTNGFYKFPNGLIVQWGIWTGAAAINGVAVTYAGNFAGCIAFPNNTLSLILQPIKTSTSPHAFFLTSGSISQNGFTVSTDTTWGNGYYFIALGN